MPGIGFAARDLQRDGAGRVRIVDRLAGVGAEVVDREAASAQMRDDRRFQRNGRVIAGDRDRANVGARRQRRLVAVAALSRRPIRVAAFSVSAASGVTCPPATSVTVLPYSSTRASASVII